MHERTELVADWFERPLLVAAVLTIPVTILQLLPPPDPWRTLADVLNWMIWLAFLTEVVVMLAMVPSKGQWLRRHPIDVAIVLLTAPVLAAFVQSVRVLRLLRLLRFLRLAPLIRVLCSAEGLRYAALLAFLTALTGGAAFASVEHVSVGDGIYWAITTMTTVGYGDVTPKTPEGKAITIAVMLVGIGFATLVIGAAAERFVQSRQREPELGEEGVLSQIRDISAQLQRLERSLQQSQSLGDPSRTAAPKLRERRYVESSTAPADFGPSSATTIHTPALRRERRGYANNRDRNGTLSGRRPRVGVG